MCAGVVSGLRTPPPRAFGNSGACLPPGKRSVTADGQIATVTVGHDDMTHHQPGLNARGFDVPEPFGAKAPMASSKRVACRVRKAGGPGVPVLRGCARWACG
ncbi:hypothetical protein GCM10015535_44620 [Streptomyces gelaticus]|uniref:Uncharacterized protein n=1 Tax=Streptomyces gelaticus TaxID=285446 RepID=A0ABQ2W294_9ACTN|nr:hypothetical protein GCM10015535_44620 [Streptomyces gelaticus]